MPCKRADFGDYTSDIEAVHRSYYLGDVTSHMGEINIRCTIIHSSLLPSFVEISCHRCRWRATMYSSICSGGSHQLLQRPLFQTSSRVLNTKLEIFPPTAAALIFTVQLSFAFTDILEKNQYIGTHFSASTHNHLCRQRQQKNEGISSAHSSRHSP